MIDLKALRQECEIALKNGPRHSYVEATAPETVISLLDMIEGKVGGAQVLDDKTRLEFVMERNIHWFMGYSGGRWQTDKNLGTLVYTDKTGDRAYSEGATYLEALDGAIVKEFPEKFRKNCGVDSTRPA